MGKVICVRLPNEAVWSEFQAYVSMKYGKTKGVLGEEVCYALEKYLELPEKMRARTHINSPPQIKSRTMKNLKKITRNILKETRKEIPQNHVEQIITYAVGGDGRTLRRYICHLQDLKILSPSREIKKSGGAPKFIYEVNLIEANKLVGVHEETQRTL